MIKKKYSVIAPKELLEKLPENIRKEVDKLMDDMVSGEFNPETDGTEIRQITDEYLLCGKCGSENIDWFLGGGEVDYMCNNCNAKAWMTIEEFEKAKKKHPNLVVRKK